MTIKRDKNDPAEVRARLEAYLERRDAQLEADRERAERRRARVRRVTFGLLGR